MKHEMDRQIGAASAVIQAMNRTAAMNELELEGKALPALTHVQPLCVGIIELFIQVAKISFLRKAAGLSLRESLKSLVIQGDVWSRTVALPCQKEQFELVWVSGACASWASPVEVIWAHPAGKKAGG